jgi:hypothetical protein
MTKGFMVNILPVPDASKIGIGGRVFLSTPATPPDKRVRIQRFEKLRLGEARYYSQLVRPAKVEYSVEQHFTVTPPATSIARHLLRSFFGSSSCDQFPVGSRALFPVFELDCPHSGGVSICPALVRSFVRAFSPPLLRPLLAPRSGSSPSPFQA